MEEQSHRRPRQGTKWFLREQVKEKSVIFKIQLGLVTRICKPIRLCLFD